MAEQSLFPEIGEARLKPQLWNLWHGCHKKSEGCAHCYVYRRDAKIGVDSDIVHKTSSFGMPTSRDRYGNYKIPSGTLIFTCFTSDFFIEEADKWRNEAWAIIRERADLHFYMVTKRPERIATCLPTDWGNGYANVTVSCTMENQKRTDERLPIFASLPIVRKEIICEPLLERIDFRRQIGHWCSKVIVGGESGPEARTCDYAWVVDIRRQCLELGVGFHFKQTGAKFRKDGRIYQVPRQLQQPQARKANIDL